MKHKNFFLILLVLGGGISGYYLYLFWRDSPTATVSVAWTGRAIGLVAAGVLLQLAGHYLRAVKWRLLLVPIRPTKVRTLFKGVAVGFLYNSLLPFRIGEFLRADLVGRAMSISRTVVFGTIVLERLIDGVIVVVLAAVLLRLHPEFARGTNMTVILASLLAVLVVVAAGLACLYLQNRRLLRVIRSLTYLFNDRLRDRLRFVAWSGIYGLRLIGLNAPLAAYAGLSVVMWACYLTSTMLIITGLATAAGAAALGYAAVVSYLSVAVPSGPAYLGTYHYFFTDIVGPLVRPATGLYAASITTWAVMTLPIAACGVVLLLLGRRQHRVPSESGRELTLRNKLYRDYDISKELSDFLDAYFSGAELSHALSHAEMTGRVKLLRTFKGGSNAITMLAWVNGEARVRKMTLPQHAEKLKVQHDWLKDRAHIPHLPRVLHEDTTPGQYSFEIKYASAYKPFFDYIHSQSDEASSSVIRRVLDFMQAHIYRQSMPIDPERKVQEHIEAKVVGKIRDTMALSHKVAALAGYDTLVVNGETFDNWHVILDKILHNERVMHDLVSYAESEIHGDLTVDNIIVNPDTGDFIVLDPNNENRVSSRVIDMATLYQSLHSGYEFLRNLEQAQVKGNVIHFEEHVSSRYNKLLAALEGILKQELEPAEYRSILFHEAVQYCRMLTYRAKINPDTLPAFYAIAVRLFNQFYQQYDS